MQSFPEAESDGRMTVTLAGEVLVVDIEFLIDRQDASRPFLKIGSVKTSYATSNDSAGQTKGGSASLDAFLLSSIQTFCAEVQKEDDQQDALEARRLSQRMIGYFRYLMMLESLALKVDGGIRWFVDIEQLCVSLETFAKQEADKITSYVLITQSKPIH